MLSEKKKKTCLQQKQVILNYCLAELTDSGINTSKEKKKKAEDADRLTQSLLSQQELINALISAAPVDIFQERLTSQRK